MKSFVAFGSAVVIIACQVCARPQANAAASASTPAPEGNVSFVKNDFMPLDGKGAYSYDIELSDGTKLIQSGHTEAPAMGETEPSIVIEGSYAYVAPDGKQISITYIADKNGFQPKGDSIPTQGSSNNSSSGSSASSGAGTTAEHSPEAAAPPPPAPPAPPAASVETPAAPAESAPAVEAPAAPAESPVAVDAPAAPVPVSSSDSDAPAA